MDTHFTLSEIYEKLGSSKHTLGLKGVIQRLERRLSVVRKKVVCLNRPYPYHCLENEAEHWNFYNVLELLAVQLFTFKQRTLQNMSHSSLYWIVINIVYLLKCSFFIHVNYHFQTDNYEVQLGQLIKTSSMKQWKQASIMKFSK